MLWTGFSDSRSPGRRSACPKVSRPRSIWRLLSASRLSGYSAASYRNKMHRRAAAIPAGIAVALFTGGDRTAWRMVTVRLLPRSDQWILPQNTCTPGIHGDRLARRGSAGICGHPRKDARTAPLISNFFFFINKSHCAWIWRSGVLCLSPKAIFEQTATAPKGERCTDV